MLYEQVRRKMMLQTQGSVCNKRFLNGFQDIQKPQDSVIIWTQPGHSKI
jgi:hypothetical protein